MYTEIDREKFMKDIISKVDKSNNLLGTYIIGSASIGFRDIYSDCDFMMAYKENCNPKEIRNEILNFFDKKNIGYVMERNWSETIWGISVYMKNGLSTDISFGPLDELKVRTKQISVGTDTNDLLNKHLLKQFENLKEKDIDYCNAGWNYIYLIRKIKIALYRNNDIYAYQLLNDARYQLMNIEGIKEKQKMHEFKAYNELDKSFLEEIYLTIPNSIEKQEIERCYKILLEMFWNLSDKWDKNLEYLLEI